MKKVITLVLSLVLAAAMAQTAFAATRLGWNVPDPDGHPWTETAKEIAEKIAERSNGSLEVMVYPNNQMGQIEAGEMVANGSLAMNLGGAAGFAGYYAPAEILTLPYTFDDAAQGYAWFDSKYGKEVFDKVEELSGVMTLDLWYFGNRELSTKGVDVTKPEDLKGTAIRCMDSKGSKCVIESLGGTPVPMALAETYLALQTGAVKGQENPLPTIIAAKFSEVQDHIVLTHHSVHMGTVNFSSIVWNQLTEEQQQIILDVLAEYRPIVTQRIMDKQEADLYVLRDQGMKIQEVDLEAFRANAAEVVSKTYGGDAEWAKVIEDLNTFKAEYKAQQ